MTPRERVLGVLRREELYPVPFEFGATPAFADALAERIGTRGFADHFDFECRGVEWGPPVTPPDYARYVEARDLPDAITIGEWGVATMPEELYSFTRQIHLASDIQTLAEFEEYPFPDVSSKERHGRLEEATAAVKERGHAVVAEMKSTIFEVAWRTRSLEQLFFDHIDRPEIAAFLLDNITERKAFMAGRFAEAGVDLIQFSDDIATQRGPMMSMAMWREWYKPRLARVIQAAKDANPSVLAMYCSDGLYEPFMDDLIEIGIDVLSPIEPECMDPEALKGTFGDRVAFWGAVGTQTTMPLGSVDEVREIARQRIRTVGNGGGLVVAPTHVLEPEVPVDNLLALAEETRSYRP
jgi:uroporphyrinogen decarboxylase